ncbi:MAG: VOC family protein [Proteobacteria bacterium]|nr:VOC family protein [Pseudomonadota bacterium]MDA1326225.1 VOC family protein [Pseudomonadota bacterium]
MWTIGKIDHVVVWVRDLEKSMAFYETLGFEINRKSLQEHREGKIPFVAVKAGPHNQIDLRPNPNWIPVEREKGNMQHVNVVVEGIEDIQVLVDELAVRGITPDYGPEIQGGSWRIDVYDPDNNRIEMALGVPA